MNEFEEIKNDVLVENNAQFIFQHIKELENDIQKHGKRWFWELLQNAKDARKETENVIIETLYNGNKLIFRHTGKEFTKKEIAHLIFHGSTKKDDATKTGKFGTGFMTTHLLSKEVTIEGRLFDNGECFKFLLDRNGNNDSELQKTLEQSWKRFEKSKIECNENSSYNTQFTYEVNSNRTEIVDAALNNLKQTIPFVLSSNSEIQEVIISNNGNSFAIRKEKEELINEFLQEFEINIDQHKIQILKLEKELDVEFKYQKDDNIETKTETIKISVNIELDNNQVKEIENGVPRFFYDFPLFTTESFNIPIVINSLSFEPKTERDGIYLGNSNTYDVKKNKIILSKSFELFLNLIDELIDRNIEKIYSLIKIKRIDIPDADNDWLNNEFRGIIRKIIDKKVIRNNKNELINLSEAIIPLLSTSETEHEIDFWLLVNEIFPNNIVLKENYQYWINIIRDWKRLIDEKFIFEKNVKDIAKIIENEITIEQFSEKYFSGEKTKTFQWLNDFFKIIDKTNNTFILEDHAIIPNQNGSFVKKTSEIKLDKSIDEELKNILSLLGENIKEILIDKEITYFNGKSIFSNKTQQEVYEHTISEVKNIEDYFSEQQFEASKKMLKWLLTNNTYEPLEGFPISVNLSEERRKIYKLSSSQKLLAPISLWNPECFRKYSDIFNNEFIINEEYSQIIKDYINNLENKGYLYSKPLYSSDWKFTKEDLQKIISVKVEDDFWEENEDISAQIEIPEIEVSHITYFINPSEKSVIRNSRKSKKQTQLLLEFIFNCILNNDNIVFDEKELIINDTQIKIYPSYWLAKLKSNQWVNVGKDKDEAPTSTNLSFYFEKSNELREKLKDEKVAKLLNIIGVSVGDLTKNIYAKTDKEKLDWDKAYTSILSAGHEKNISPAEIQNIFNDEQLIEEIKKKYKEKNIVKNNRNIGLTVEDIFQEIIENELSNLNIQIKKVVKGRDFDIEYDFIENGEEQFLSLEDKEKKYSIELKSTRTDYIRMTKAQGALSTDKPDYFALCVLQHDFNLEDFRDEKNNINESIRNIIKDGIRFVTDIGKRLSSEVKKVEELDNKVKETRSISSEIEVDIEEGEIKYKINEKVWKDTLKLNDFIDYLKKKLE